MKNPVQSVLLKSRVAHVWVDLFIITGLALVAAYAIAWNANADKQRKALRTPLATKEKTMRTSAPPLQTESWQAHFDQEDAMWLALGNWLSQDEKQEGHCDIAVNSVGFGSNIAVHCMGVKPHKSNPATPVKFEHIKVLAFQPTPKAKSTGKDALTAQAPLEPIKQQGWVDTHRGRRHFDTAKQRWLP